MKDEKIYELLRDLSNISKILNRKISSRMNCKRFSVYPYLIVNQLEVDKAKTLTELSKTLGLPNSTTSVIIDRLMKEGLVRKEKDEKDKRRSLIYVTEKALAEEKKLIFEHTKYFKELLEDATEDDMEAIMRGVKLLMENIQRSVE
ncbi:DNA-binding MarR family transcriptional regulator [Clostridium tetanomorphum]|uniref:MarR family transcriptional regulator n=1 Tax=Clostridium tetanomorphum TaxID=1553 RepID=A0A923E8F8_CLOTT|nr:MarR family transcriptional regulator [Clostridium tetanomorphum]KAJ48788.1 transcriptional regulator [Clostridium tetanomorphum DSM 665]KAJ52045.1 transcriptional regulator [Clostridium tetanomorphum DSM 665]MBC2397056.1 MarR family transcriptional regulator [Clostridium tetanomorphum]MBP1862965.1 DNA-binding MarR family transcriptional regulator [Clostridium tetanomorphum]NRS82794.1 DNA-binding MarR family transcriptional regulator [Clostridium tetanomorphum]